MQTYLTSKWFLCCSLPATMRRREVILIMSTWRVSGFEGNTVFVEWHLHLCWWNSFDLDLKSRKQSKFELHMPILGIGGVYLVQKYISSVESGIHMDKSEPSFVTLKTFIAEYLLLTQKIVFNFWMVDWVKFNIILSNIWVASAHVVSKVPCEQGISSYNLHLARGDWLINQLIHKNDQSATLTIKLSI